MLTQHRNLALILLTGVVVKLAWEQFAGAVTAALFKDDTVVVDAHLYGAITGALFYFLTTFAGCFKKHSSSHLQL